jgi:hypothetical protein
MTALNIMIGEDAVRLLTDRAWQHKDGRLVKIQPKVMTCARLSIAIAYSGRQNSGSAGTIAKWLDDRSDQADVLADAADAVRLICDDMMVFDAVVESHGRPAMPRSFNLFLALWSRERGRPEAYRIETKRGVAGALQSVASYHWPPVDHSLAPRRFDPAAARVLLEAQRRVRLTGGRYYVGGGADLTTITKDGLTTETLCTWPDRIGALIRP